MYACKYENICMTTNKQGVSGGRVNILGEFSTGSSE
jgi:hypothetical protein